MEIRILFIVFILVSNICYPQFNCNSERAKPIRSQEAIQDIDFLVNKIKSVHVNPYSLYSKEEFDKRLALIKEKSKYFTNYGELYAEANSIMSLLNDEHAQIYSKCIKDSIKRTRKSLNMNQLSLLSLAVIDGYGYLKVNSFVTNKNLTLDNWKYKIDSIFNDISRLKIDTLVIDVSDNGGGNSKVGEFIINYIYNHNYLGYGKKFRFSSDFKKSAMGNGYYDDSYDTLKEGEVTGNNPWNKRISVTDKSFQGKTYILVGKNTFSSAIMFATIILDNNIAAVVGEVPEKGHPNHFGEILKFEMPNSKFIFVLSCKEWIRPNQNAKENRLIPNIEITVEGKTEEEIVRQLKSNISTR